MYFGFFPLTYYTLDNRNSVQVVTNILIRNIINRAVQENYSAYDEYDIPDGETPEIVSDKIYGNPMYHWVILHFNDILDPRFGWPLSTNNLISYCNAKYNNPQGVHHYEDSEGNVVDPNNPGAAVSVSNFQYEERLNEEKRRIKVIKPSYLQTIVEEFEDKIKS